MSDDTKKENIPPSVGEDPDGTKAQAYQLQEKAEADARFRLGEKVEALKTWQATGHVHPLTCGGCDERENVLVPQVEGDQVVLVCPTCGWKQTEDQIPVACFFPPSIPNTMLSKILEGRFEGVSMGCSVAPHEPCPLCRDRADRGLYGKFTVGREDGRDLPGGDRERADYFVLDLTFDPFAIPALRAYADACEGEYPALAADLRKKLAEQTGG